MFRLRGDIKLFSGIKHSQKTRAFELLNSRWKLLHSEIHSAGFFLDPEYWANDYRAVAFRFELVRLAHAKDIYHIKVSQVGQY